MLQLGRHLTFEAEGWQLDVDEFADRDTIAERSCSDGQVACEREE